MFRGLLLWLVGMARFLAGRLQTALRCVRAPARTRLAERFPGAPEHWLRDIVLKFPDDGDWITWDAADSDDEPFPAVGVAAGQVGPTLSREKDRATRPRSLPRQPRTTAAPPKASLYPPRARATHPGPSASVAERRLPPLSFLTFPSRERAKARPIDSVGHLPPRPPMPGWLPQSAPQIHTYVESEVALPIATPTFQQPPLQYSGSTWPDRADAPLPLERFDGALTDGTERADNSDRWLGENAERLTSRPDRARMWDATTRASARASQFGDDTRVCPVLVESNPFVSSEVETRSTVPTPLDFARDERPNLIRTNSSTSSMQALPLDAPWPALALEVHVAAPLPPLRPDLDRLRIGQEGSRWSE